MQFNRKNAGVIARWWWTVDHRLLSALIILTVIGGILILSSSPSVAERNGIDAYHYVKKQSLFIFSGLILMFSMSTLSVIWVRRIGIIGFFVTLLFLALLPFIGVEIKGATRWVPLGFFTLQPSEFAKPLLAIVVGWMLSERYRVEGFRGYTIATLLYAVVALFLIFQPDWGMFVVVSGIWAGQMFVAGLPLLWLPVIIVAGVTALFLGYEFFPHVTKRIDSFLSPDAHENYQIEKSLEAFSHGGLLGVGPAQGVTKRHLPDSHTDFIFSVAGEEFGLAMTLFMLLVFGYVVFRGMQKIRHEQDLFIVFAVTGLLLHFGGQVIINMGVSLHLLPTKGMTLPFISYGGSSFWSCALGMGMFLALTRRRFGCYQDKA